MPTSQPFLLIAGVIEDANLPGELKRHLSHIRELDTQSQELFERMQRLSKNHIAKAKRSVQDGREPDEEYLAKARKTYRELVDIDDEKMHTADQMHAAVTKYYAQCTSELRKFEEELKEKGQLKTPQMKTQLSRMESLAGNDPDASEGLAGSSTGPSDAPSLAGAGGRRGRQSCVSGSSSSILESAACVVPVTAGNGTWNESEGACKGEGEGEHSGWV